jgi:hypothetical protein
VSLTSCPRCGFNLLELGSGGLALGEVQRRLAHRAAFWLRRVAKSGARPEHLATAEAEAWECANGAFLPATLNAALRSLLEVEAPNPASARELAEALIWAAS